MKVSKTRLFILLAAVGMASATPIQAKAAGEARLMEPAREAVDFCKNAKGVRRALCVWTIVIGMPVAGVTGAVLTGAIEKDPAKYEKEFSKVLENPALADPCKDVNDDKGAIVDGLTHKACEQEVIQYKKAIEKLRAGALDEKNKTTPKAH